MCTALNFEKGVLKNESHFESQMGALNKSDLEGLSESHFVVLNESHFVSTMEILTK